MCVHTALAHMSDVHSANSNIAYGTESLLHVMHSPVFQYSGSDLFLAAV